MKMTTRPPTVAGHYWWTNLGEHTPSVMRVTGKGKHMYATDGEYDFGFDPTDGPDVITSAEEDWDEPVLTIDGVDYYYGSHFWSGPIELPELGGETLQPDSF